MATLADVVDELKDNGDGIDRVYRTMDDVLKQLNMQRLDALESAREAKSAASAGGGSSSSGGGGGFGFLPGLGMAGVLGTTLAAVAASLVGLDDAIRAAKIGQVAANVAKAIGRFADGTRDVIKGIGDVTKRVGNFGKNLLKVVVIPDETKALFASFVDDIKLRWMLFTDGVKALFSVKLEEFKPSIVGNIVGFVTDSLATLKASILTTIPEDIAKVTDSIAETVRPITNFFGSLSDKIGNIGKYMPTIDFGALRTVFVGAEGAGGILGFFNSVFEFAKPLLKPLKYAFEFAMRPFFQIMLSVVDFVVGFYKGFTGEDGSFADKLKAGIEGGIKGVIKGFTDAIDLIFIDLPAWIAEKLGFDSFADTLREFSLTDMVDPAFEAVKNFFGMAFSDPAQAFGPLLDAFKNLPLDFLKKIIAAVLPPADFFTFNLPEADLGILGKFGGGSVNLNPFPDSLYEFAGLKESQAQQVQKSMASNESAMELEAYGGSRGDGGGTVVISDNSTGDVVSSSNNQLLQTAPAAVNADDPYEIN